MAQIPQNATIRMTFCRENAGLLLGKNMKIIDKQSFRGRQRGFREKVKTPP